MKTVCLECHILVVYFRYVQIERNSTNIYITTIRMKTVNTILCIDGLYPYLRVLHRHNGVDSS